jgi:hypothetical protein
MANTFRLKSKANVTNNAISHNDAKIYTAGGSVVSTVVLGISLANTTSGSVTVDVQIESDTSHNSETNTTSYLGKSLPVPSGGTLEIMQGNKLVLEDTDIIRVRASAGSSVDVLISIMEIT